MAKTDLLVTLWLNHTDDASAYEDITLQLEVDEEGFLRVEHSDDELEPYIELRVEDLLEAIRQVQS